MREEKGKGKGKEKEEEEEEEEEEEGGEVILVVVMLVFMLESIERGWILLMSLAIIFPSRTKDS
jgi:hypothetical protein